MRATIIELILRGLQVHVLADLGDDHGRTRVPYLPQLPGTQAVSTATLRGRGWPSLCADVCERRPANQPPEFLSPWAGFRTYRNYRETQPGTPVVAPTPRPFVSLKCRGAGWGSTVPRTGHSCPWTSRSTHHELGFRTFRVGSGRLELGATWRTQATREG